MKWNVFYFDINKQKIDKFNIFEHCSFVKYIEKHLKKCKTKEEFAEHLKSELIYFFWSKCEWELVIEITEDNRIFLNPWVGCKEPDKVRIDVTDDTSLDWKSFAKKHTKRQVYGNKAKIDVYEQVMSNWEIFLDYVWNNK